MPKSSEQLNKSIGEVTNSELKEKDTYELELVHSPELDNLSNTLNEVQEIIDTDQDLAANHLLALKEAIDGIKVEIGGEEFTLEEIKDIENLKANAEIWQEMEAGDFSRTKELTLLSKKAKELISNYTGKNLDLHSLTFVEYLTLPDSIGGYLDLGGLTSAKNLILPDFIGGNLNLHSLISAEHLKLPDSISGNLYLNGLTSAEHLKLPDSLGSILDLRRLTEIEKEKLRKKYPQHADKII